ncbi:MAG TPA: DinB family protein [Gemmatimonadaceae bacterium]
MNRRDLDARLDRNRVAVERLIAAAVDTPIGPWSVRLAPDKWTPAQHVSHIVLSYQAFTADVRDGRTARLIGSARQRLIWRAFGLSQVLWLGRIPPGARSPREMQPPDVPPERDALVHKLGSGVSEFEAAVRQVWRTMPKHRVAHPYFGSLSLGQAIRVCEVHTMHHAAVLERERASI